MKKVFIIGFSLSFIIFTFLLSPPPNDTPKKTQEATKTTLHSLQKKDLSCNTTKKESKEKILSYAQNQEQKQNDCVFYGCNIFEQE